MVVVSATDVPTTARTTPRVETLVRAHRPGLVRLATRALGDVGLAEDVVQEACLALSRSGPLDRPDDEVLAWLRRVVLNGAHNRRRGEQRARDRVERAAQLNGVDGTAEEQGLATVLRREEHERVRAALERIPERQRDALLLRHAGCSYSEVAAALGCAPSSVGVLLARGARAFRTTYTQHEEHRP